MWHSRVGYAAARVGMRQAISLCGLVVLGLMLFRVGAGRSDAAGLAQEGDEERPVGYAAFTGKPYVVSQAASPTSTEPEIEEHIASSSAAPNDLVAVITDLSKVSKGDTQYAYSDDNGKKWSEGKLLPLKTADNKTWDALADPAVAIDGQAQPNVYILGLYEDEANITVRGIYVATKPFSKLGDGFEAKDTLPVFLSTPNLSSIDKPWIAIDTSTAEQGSTCRGYVYLAWTTLSIEKPGAPVKVSVQFAYSKNNGKDWTVSTLAGPIGYPAENLWGVQVAVGPPSAKGKAGPVYVAYDRFAPGNLGKFEAKKGEIFVKQSNDCGANFGDPLSATGKFNDLGGNHFKDTLFRLNSAPAMAVSPRTGTVAIVWASCSVAAADCDGGAGAEVKFTRRKVADKAFSQPVVINDKPDGQQFFPAFAADRAGLFHASWLDSRNNNAPTKLDVYATYTKDEGDNFGQNARVTAGPFNIDPKYTVLGDYTGNAAGQTSPAPDTSLTAHPVWNDGGVFSDNTGKGKLQTATLTVPK